MIEELIPNPTSGHNPTPKSLLLGCNATHKFSQFLAYYTISVSLGVLKGVEGMYHCAPKHYGSMIAKVADTALV